MNESTKMVIVLVIVSLLSATSLSMIYEKTKPIIENNKLGELKASLKEVMPDAEWFEENEDLIGLISSEREGVKQIFDAYGKEENKIGVVVLMDTMGFGGIIRMLIGIDLKDNNIAGMKILDHLETPGLGERITGDEFLNQFKGKSTDINADEVDAITGATISSRAVINAVTENVNKISGYITEKGGDVMAEATITADNEVLLTDGSLNDVQLLKNNTNSENAGS